MKKRFLLLSAIAATILTSCGGIYIEINNQYKIKTPDGMVAVPNSENAYQTLGDTYILIMKWPNTSFSGYEYNADYLNALITEANVMQVVRTAEFYSVGSNGTENNSNGKIITYASYINIGSDGIYYQYDTPCVRSNIHFYIFEYGCAKTDYETYHLKFMKSFYTINETYR